MGEGRGTLGLTTCDLGGGLHSPERSDVGSAFTVLGAPDLGLPNGLHITRNPRGHRTASRWAGQRAHGL